MALNLAQKKEIVAEVAEVAAKAHSLVGAEYAGLSVSQLTELRVKARQGGVYVRVVKNTLVEPRGGGHRVRVHAGCAHGPADLRILAGRPGCCRSSDRGFCQGE